jgi:diaminopimelate epimerase
MTFSRWDANGNIYLLVESAELTADDVQKAVGDADGILQIVGVEQTEADVVIWNPDGSTAELSGNGTRIVAAWLAERTGADEVRVRVGRREVHARALADGRIEQELGRVEVGERETVAGIELTPVSVGNPHAVVVGNPDDIERLGPLLENHTRFPERTNVQVVRLEGDGRVTARVWERGVGETASSGTSAAAVAAATQGDGEVVVRFPGGDLTVRIADGRATVIGSARRVA